MQRCSVPPIACTSVPAPPPPRQFPASFPPWPSCTGRRYLEAPILRITGADTPFPLAFERLYLPDELKVYDAIKQTVAY